MSTDTEAHKAQIEEGFAALRSVCDYRGHDLLDALRDGWLHEIDLYEAAVRATEATIRITHPFGVVENIQDYSRKV